MRASRYIPLLVLILAAFALRLYRIDAQSIWFDEGWSAYAAVQPDLGAAFDADPTNPPLYYVLLHVTARFWGDSPFGLRLTSTLLGLLTIPLTAQLAARLFNHRAGIYAGFLAAASPLLWWTSQEARMYTLLAVLVLAAALAWHRLISHPSRGAWLALLAAEILILYAHNTGPIVMLWLNGVTVLVWLVRRSLRQPDWRAWWGGQIAVGLLWLPWLLARFMNVQAANSAIYSGPQIGADLFSRLGQAVWTAPWEMVGREPLLLALSVVAWGLTLILIPWRRANARWLVTHVVLLVAGLIVGLSFIGNQMHGRYLVMISPLLLAVLGAGITRLRESSLRVAAAGLFGLIGLTNLILAQNPLYQHDDVRGMVTYYADSLTAEDTVLAWSYADRYDLAYYWNRLNVTAGRVTLPEGAVQAQVVPLLPDSGRIALNQWYTQRADYRGMLPCLLGHGSTNPPAAFTTYGMSTGLYEAPPETLPEMKPFDARVGVNGTPLPLAVVTGVGQSPASTGERARCVPVTLRVDSPITVDLRAALIVRNAQGWDVVQESGIFASANQRTTSGLNVGESAVAYALLRLPVGAPPGNYELRLRVFSDREPSGYDVIDDAGHVLGKDLPLGIWRVEPGADWSQVRRESDLPNRLDVPFGEDLTLVGHDLETGAALTPGQDVRLTLLWQGRGPLPDLILSAADGAWEARISPSVDAHDDWTLDWRTLRVPADAASGDAELRLPDGTILTTYSVAGLPLLNEAPEFTVPVDQALGSVGTLVGYTPGAQPADRTEPYPVTLIWQAGSATPETSYTVFVQMLDATGRLIAQSDALPAQGERPTTGWRAGEYLMDRHFLQFNDLAAPGEAHLIVGMYDARTGQRISAVPGQDWIGLPGTIIVR
ncbi:MAG: glycosyltransferase family 39 protein [Anaerolineae bacterium]|nr:glycosyltransferase family 39 protein [Anaerolineae bacterium]